MSMRKDGDTYFFDLHGNRRFGGVLSVDNAPLDWRHEDGSIPTPPAELLKKQEDFTVETTPVLRHFAAREVAKSKCECYWVELQDPNKESYFYDYVTNSWCWESPASHVVYQSIQVLPTSDETLTFSLGIAIEELEQRISQL